MVSWFLGLQLLSAAAFKLYGSNVQPFASFGWLMSPPVQFAAVEREILLGLWLCSGFGRTGAWLAAGLTFLAFAAVSFVLGVQGQASCDCFGSLKASPWHAFSVDLVALVLLGIGRTSGRLRQRDTRLHELHEHLFLRR